MKKLIYSLVITFLMGLSVNAFAQKTVAFFDSKTTKQSVDTKISQITFQLSNIENTLAMQKYYDIFKANSQVVREINSTMLKAGMASYSIKMAKVGLVPSLQNLFLSAGIESVNIDGQEVATKNLAAYVKEEKAKKNKNEKVK